MKNEPDRFAAWRKRCNDLEQRVFYLEDKVKEQAGTILKVLSALDLSSQQAHIVTADLEELKFMLRRARENCT